MVKRDAVRIRRSGGLMHDMLMATMMMVPEMMGGMNL